MPWAFLKVAAGFWREGLIALLVVACLVQESRVRGAKVKVAELAGKVAVLEQRAKDAATAQALRELHNLKNKERTDAQYFADLARAGAAVVRLDKPARGITVAGPVAAPGRGDEPTVCFDRGRLAAELNGFLDRAAERANAVLADVVRLEQDRSTRIARAGEGLAAAYRGCRVFAIGIDGARLGDPKASGR